MSLPEVHPHSGSGASFFKKKVAGVPVVYLVGGFVACLLVIAWKMKAAPAASDATATDPTATGTTGAVDQNGDPSAVYPNMPTGTVVVAPQTDAGTPAVVEDNTDWLKKSVLYLVNSKGASPGDAQLALDLYLQGANLSYAQGQLRDAAVKQYGLPPDPGSVGTTGTKPPVPVPVPVHKPSVPVVARQGTPPCVHTVRGPGDNDLTKLIHLYYGSVSNDKYDLIQAANPHLAQGGTYKVGTKVTIPKYHAPKYYTATKTTVTASAIASKNGTSTHSLAVLNDGMHFPVKVGTKVRVA